MQMFRVDLRTFVGLTNAAMLSQNCMRKYWASVGGMLMQETPNLHDPCI